MPHKLCQRFADRAPVGKYAGEHNLFLQVRATKHGKTVTWQYRMKDPNKSSHGYTFKSLGKEPELDYNRARQMADDMRVYIADGLNLNRAYDQALQGVGLGTAPTFKMLAEEHLDNRATAHKTRQEKRDCLARLEKHVYPYIGARPIDTITTVHLAEMTRAVWSTAKQQGRKISPFVHNVFKYAEALGHIENSRLADPTFVKTLLPRTLFQVKETRHPALRPDQCPTIAPLIWENYSTASDALILTMLTGSRSGPICKAEWKEFDLRAATWTIPVIKLKSDRLADGTLVLPLPQQAVAMLKRRWLKAGRRGQWVFPSDRGASPHISGSVMRTLLHRLGYGENGPNPRCVPHGFRTSLRTWVEVELSKQRTDEAFKALNRAIEIQLAHKERKQITSAENKYIGPGAELLELRRSITQEWADYILPPRGAA